MKYTPASPPGLSTLEVRATSNKGKMEERLLARYTSADEQGYLRFHEPDIVEFAEGSRSDKYAEIGVMLVNLTTWDGPEIRFSDAAEYDSVPNGYFLAPVVDGDKIALITQMSEERRRFYRIRVWEPHREEWHECFILGAKDLSVRFLSDDQVQVRVDWGENRVATYLLDIRWNRFEVK